MNLGPRESKSATVVLEAEEYAVLAAQEGRSFRILQLTDFHNDVSDELTERTYDDIRALVRIHQPDLLAVTGDIWCGDDKPEIAPALMRRDLEFLGSLQMPWAFTWGNHDYIADFEADMARLRAAPFSIMPEGDGRGNFRIEIRNDDTPVWDLYFLNSHTECLLPEDLAWLEAEASRVKSARESSSPAIAYFHIPLEQYETARLSGRVIGIAQEEVAYWGNTSDRFEPIRRTETIRACFVGHSHVNDFHTVEDGVVLAYGRVIGHGGYGAELLRKGATLLELDTATDRFAFKTVFPDGSDWSHGSDPSDRSDSLPTTGQ